MQVTQGRASVTVLTLAAATGMFLPIAPGSVIGRGDGLEMVVAAAAATGNLKHRVGSCRMGFLRA